MTLKEEKEYVCTFPPHKGKKLSGITLERCREKECEFIGVVVE